MEMKKTGVPVTMPSVTQASAFPRGGALSLNPLEFRDIVDQATQDTLLPTKPSKRTKNESFEKQKKLKSESDEPKLPVVESLTFRVITINLSKYNLIIRN